MGISKIGEGKYILYLEECPDCGEDRVLNKEKLLGASAYTAAGIGAGLFFGVPVLGVLGAIGIIKLAIAGSIAVGAAVQLIKWNYNILVELNKENIYKCPACGSSKLVKVDDILGQKTTKSLSNTADKVITQIGSSIERANDSFEEKSKAIIHKIISKKNNKKSK